MYRIELLVSVPTTGAHTDALGVAASIATSLLGSADEGAKVHEFHVTEEDA